MLPRDQRNSKFQKVIFDTSSLKVKSVHSALAKLHRPPGSDPHPKIRPIAIFAFHSLNYSLAACYQDNSRRKLPTKVEAKRKLQQFTVSGWLIMNGGESSSEKKRKLQG